jgi:membrane protease YdiL (CAAX protease family)
MNAAPSSAVATRPLLPPFPGREMVVPGILLAALTVAEYVVAAVNPTWGLPMHAVILLVCLALGATANGAADRELYWTLALAPVIRIGSLSLPLGRLPLISWYPLIGVPVFTAAFVTMRKLGYTADHVNLRIRIDDTVRQLSLIPLGAVLGAGEYLIFRPAPLQGRPTFEDTIVPALVLIVFTGFEEELIFRGLMQRAALRALGRWGLVYVNLVFAALHIGYLSVLDLVFVFLVGFLFSLFVLRTRSLFGVTLAHGAINIGLFLVFPFLAPIVLGTGAGDLLPLPVPPTFSPPSPR